MNYLDKCSEQKDFLFNKLKPSRNIIVFIVFKNVYHAYILKDMKTIMSSEKKHYIEGTDKLETFFYLPNGIRIDSSLSLCFNNKVNTMKLIESENKFYIGFGSNKQFYSYYRVVASTRQDINSEEESTFIECDSAITNSDSEVEIDMSLLLEQRETRRLKEKLQLKIKNEEEKNTECYTETKNYENGVVCMIYYENGHKTRESWRTNNQRDRKDGLPASIGYYANGNKSYEEWWIDGQHYREDDLPANIEYFENGDREIEEWYVNDCLHRGNGLPAFIVYYKNGNKELEKWYINNRLHRDNDLPALIVYYENGNRKLEKWYVNGCLNRGNDLPPCVEYLENGDKKFRLLQSNSDSDFVVNPNKLNAWKNMLGK